VLTPESLKDWVPTVGTLLAAVVGLTGMAIATRMPLLVVSEDGVGEGPAYMVRGRVRLGCERDGVPCSRRLRDDRVAPWRVQACLEGKGR
jgi:hypothetical protein